MAKSHHAYSDTEQLTHCEAFLDQFATVHQRELDELTTSSLPLRWGQHWATNTQSGEIEYAPTWSHKPKATVKPVPLCLNCGCNPKRKEARP